MAFVHTFCFEFSLRLGTIIISMNALVHSTILVVFLLLNLENPADLSTRLQKLIITSDFLNRFFDDIQFFEEFFFYIIGLLAFYCVMAISSIILLIGAYQCKPSLIYQFLLLYIIYIFLLCFYMLVIYLSLIPGGDPLGTILYSSMAFFVFLFYAYTWICVYSLTQVIREVRKKLLKQVKRPPRHFQKKVAK